jgi:hypothetical protein
MVGYTMLENAVVEKLITHFSGELSPSRCKPGDMDAVMEAIFTENAYHGCIIEYAGGYESARSPFDKSVWVWSMFCIFVIRYDDGGRDIEAMMRSVVDKLATLLEGDHTLSGVTARARITEINAAEPVTVNEYPFYWLPFTVEVIDR